MSEIILHILPRSFVKFNSGRGGSQALFYIPLECKSRHRVTGVESDYGLPCDEYLAGETYCGHVNDAGKRISHTLSATGRRNKRLIERYNKYRLDIFHLCKQAEFALPTGGWSIYFYFPCPKRFSKKKRLALHGQKHYNRPDVDGCLKGFFDALTTKDEYVGQLSGLGKFWFLPELVQEERRQGYIQILTNEPQYNPFNVTWNDQHLVIQMEDIITSREKRKARKEEIKAAKEVVKPVRRTPKPIKIIEDKIK